MGLLSSLIRTTAQVALMPVRVAVDVVSLPSDAVNGRIPFQCTAKGIEDTAEELL